MIGTSVKRYVWCYYGSPRNIQYIPGTQLFPLLFPDNGAIGWHHIKHERGFVYDYIVISPVLFWCSESSPVTSRFALLSFLPCPIFSTKMNSCLRSLLHIENHLLHTLKLKLSASGQSVRNLYESCTDQSNDSLLGISQLLNDYTLELPEKYGNNEYTASTSS